MSTINQECPKCSSRMTPDEARPPFTYRFKCGCGCRLGITIESGEASGFHWISTNDKKPKTPPTP